WELISDPNAYLTSDGVHITLLDFLKIRARHFNDQGYYCSGVACIEESYFGGDYSPFLDSSTSPIVCGIAAVVSGGGASGCILVGWYDTFSNCFESDPGTCIGDFVIDEIAGRTFSLIFTPAAQGFARSLGRELTSDAAVDLFGTATNNGGIGNALTVAVGGTDTVNAPPLCEFSTCASRILDYFANNP
ncbi:hypothetical protein KC573_03600, partial [candidate division WWE3 bacterium]|nr:hypothetical protein [candidate division WWE3 bacterium]